VGYVEFRDVETARKAYEKLDGQSLDGKPITLRGERREGQGSKSCKKGELRKSVGK
jgi:hypothetical protein